MDAPDDRFRVEIEPDPHPLDPRAEYDHLGRMVCWHRRYNLGDKHDWPTPQAFAADHPDSEILKRPLFLYDHSGLTMATKPFHCPWDSGQVGWIFAEKPRILAEFQRRRFSQPLRRRVFDILDAEVREYDAYLTGDVWCVTIRDAAGDIQDSVSGIIGYDTAVEEAQNLLTP